MEWLGFPTAEKYNGLDLNELPLNHAYVVVNTTVNNVGVYAVKDACFTCPYKLQKYLKAGEEVFWEADTVAQHLWRIVRSDELATIERDNRKGILCQMRQILQERAVYRLDVGRCQLDLELPPVNPYLPFYLSLVVLFGLFAVYGLIKTYRRKTHKESGQKILQINIDKSESTTRSLHLFRDFIIFWLIFCTSGGGGYPIFNQEWGGLSLGEIFFFIFAWTVGVNVPTIMDEASNRRSKGSILKDILKRTFILIFLGIAIDSVISYHPRPDYVILWRPLERLAIAYFIVATAYVLTVHKVEMKSKLTICKAIGTFVSLMWCWIFAGLLLAAIIIALSTFTSFNCLSDTPLERQADYANYANVTQNCNNDTSEFANNIFVAETRRVVDVNSYVGYNRGVLGLLSTILYALIGLKAGVIFLHYPTHSDRLKLWLSWASFFILGSIIFAAISIPLNFNLWPMSSPIFVSSAALILFSIFYTVLEVWNLESIFTPGNRMSASLAVLCGHQLFSQTLPFRLNLHLGSHLVYLLQCYWIVFLWMGINLVLRNRVKILI